MVSVMEWAEALAMAGAWASGSAPVKVEAWAVAAAEEEAEAEAGPPPRPPAVYPFGPHCHRFRRARRLDCPGRPPARHLAKALPNRVPCRWSGRSGEFRVAEPTECLDWRVWE